MPDIQKRKLRLLVSANDLGAAFHLCEVIRRARAEMDIILLAGAAACGVFERAGCPVHVTTSSDRLGQHDESGVTAILDEAAALISGFMPDAILVGLSGPDRGMDEALVKCAGGRPTYAVQDFWGDVNPGFGRLPGTYFVLDELAAGITRNRAPLSRVVVTGSARHVAMMRVDPASLRKAFRARISATEADRIAVFFGQPLWSLPGYGKTLLKTAEALTHIEPGAAIYYRPHPKESPEECQKAHDCLGVAGLRVMMDDSPVVELPLCGADLLLTCYSTCGIDLAYLNRISMTPLASILFLLCEEDVRHFYCDTSRIEDMPLSAMGLAVTLWQSDAIEGALRNALAGGEREKRWHAARERLADPSGAAENIVKEIIADFPESF